MHIAPRVGFKPSVAFASVSDWMRRTIAAGQPVTSHQVEAWAAAFDTAERRAREIEARTVARDLSAEEIAVAAFDADLTNLILDTAVRAIDRLAELALDAATVKQAEEIPLSAAALKSALIALACGGVRSAAQTQEGA